MRWFISDTHFGHKNVIEYSKRPFKSVKEMDNNMIARWNKLVGQDDDVFVLGDFGLSSMGYLTDVLHSLNGTKILIRGNHDGSVGKMRRIGFDAVVDEAVVHIGGERVHLSHYPYFLGKYKEEFNLHGHIHEKGSNTFNSFRQLCLCVELWNYAPVNEGTIHKLIQKWTKQNGLSSEGSSIAGSGGSNERGGEV